MYTESESNTLPSWSKLYRNRLKWASDARKAFLADLESEAVAASAQDVNRCDRREVVVLGESQVGKTTLILRMHGVKDPDAMQRVEAVLRGGRKYGNSATAVATDFRVAPGNRFRIQRSSDETPEALSDDDARERLATLRDEVEHGRKSPLHQIRIEIPRDTVDSTTAATDTAATDLDIIDLPGVGGVDPGEQRHTRKLIQAHLHRAHLALIVGKADGITHLRASLENDAYLIGNSMWMHQHARFAIVLTHAASVDSIRKTLKDPDTQPRSQSEFVDIYRELVRTDWKRDASMPGVADAVAQIPIIPVELGNVQKLFGEINAHLVQQWVDGSIERLLERISESLSPIANLRYLIDSVHGARKQAKHHLDQYHKEIGDLKRKKEKLTGLIAKLQDEINYLEQKREPVREAQKNLPSVKEIVSNLKGRKRYVKPSFFRSKLMKEMDLHKSLLLGSVEATFDILSAHAREHGFESWNRDRAYRRVQASINGRMNRVRGKLNDHTTSAIVRTKKWARQVEIAKVKATKYAKKKCKQTVRGCLKKIEARYDAQLRSLAQEIQEVSAQMSTYEKKRDEVTEKIENLQRQQKQTQEIIEGDLSRWERLQNRFRQAADQEIQRLLTEADSVSHRDAVCLTAYTHVVQRIYTSIIQGTL